MFGSHLSIAGSMTSALVEAHRLGLDTVQVFTKNQQQWKVRPLEDAMVREWLAQVGSLGWQGRTVSHASYLINLASVSDELFQKSVDLMTVEVERCEALGIPFLVHHPGSFAGWTLEEGLARIIDAHAEVHKRTRGFRCVFCLEGTAGAGRHIGGDFKHLAILREGIVQRTSDPSRVGFCLDTCHLHAAGYDMSTAASATRVLDEFDALCGVANLRVWHLNDSKGDVGSHLDRHAHVGLGFVGGSPPKHAKPGKKAEPTLDLARLADSGFAAIVRDPRFAHVPKIMETPKEEDAKAASMLPVEQRLDVMNLSRLRWLMQGAPMDRAPTTPASTRASTPGPANPDRQPKPQPKPKAKRTLKPASAPAPSRASAHKLPPPARPGRGPAKPA